MAPLRLNHGMSILVFALIIIIVLALVVWAVGLLPLPSPANQIIMVLAILIGALAIANRAGIF